MTEIIRAPFRKRNSFNLSSKKSEKFEIDLQLLVEMEYHICILLDILQVNQLTWLHVVKILCIIPNISPQWNQMKKYGASIMNELKCFQMITFHVYMKFVLTTQLKECSWLKGKFSPKDWSILHQVPYILYGKRYSNPTHVNNHI